MKVVLASGNQGKLREFARLLAPLDFTVVSQGDLGITGPPEPHDTFVENALVKARHASAESGLSALADDSGLVVPSLGGAPGVKSARYAGATAVAADNNAKLIDTLFGDSPDSQNAQSPARVPAYYFCALVFMRDAHDPTPLIACARWLGAIQATPSGNSGFGYDAYFYVPQLQCSAAELDPEHKNRISHRGLASAALLAELDAKRS